MSAHARSEPITFGHVYDEIERLHLKATRLAGIANAIGMLWPEHKCSAGTAELIFLSEELANELNSEIDALSMKASELLKPQTA